jgi:translation elongation factor EF-Ts
MSAAGKPPRSNGRGKAADASTVSQVRLATECSEDDARAALAECNGDAQQAVLYLTESAFRKPCTEV